MAFRSYLPQPFVTTHENVFFREFSSRLRNHYSQREGLHVLIGNISCNGHQIDALFVASGKIIVIDFKNYGGRLEFAENNPWRIWEGNDFVFVSGGGGIRNPYQQVNAYRHSLRQYLYNRQAQILNPNHNDCNWGHINALVLFHKSIQFDNSTIPPKIQAYFSIVDYTTIYSRLQDSYSGNLILDDNEINRLLTSLELRDENLFDDTVEPENAGHYETTIAAQRLELIRRLSPNVTNISDPLRILHYYHTLVNLERFKEPKSLEPHPFPVRWAEITDELIINIESNSQFNARYQANLHEQFKKNIFVGINVLLNNVTLPLFQSIILINDILDHRRIEVKLSDLSLNLPALENRNLGEDEIEELTTRVTEAGTLEEKLQEVRDHLNVVVELVPNLTVAFSEESLVTSQLLSELKSLIRSGSNIEESKLRNFLQKKSPEKINGNVPVPLLYITQLNSSQRRAIELSFYQPLTVITGPPGTGKTQVVLNILANAVFHNKKVLFASKNNRAVDNVKEKLTALVKESGFFVRFGSKQEVREKVVPSLHQFSNRINHNLIEENELEYAEALDAVNAADSKRTHHVNRIRSIYALEKKLKQESNTLREREVDCDQHKSKFEKALSIDKGLVAKLKLEAEHRLKSLKEYVNPIKKIWFVLTQQKKQLDFCEHFKNQIPNYFIETNARLKPPVNNLVGLVAWYQNVVELSSSVQATNKEHEQKAGQVNSGRNTVEQITQQLNELKASYKNDLLAIANIENELPALGLNLLNHTIQKRLYEAGEDSLERYRAYLPDNIPWKDFDIPDFVDAANNFLEIFNAISVTSLSVKNGFPLTSELFDMVVIDEASQCDIASAIPLLYRAKQVVVIGDPLQLRHISKVEPYEEKYLQEKLGLTTYKLNYVNDSLYDYCDHLAKLSKLESVLLINHYRCHPEIIQYSNEIFYRPKFGQDLIVQTKAEQYNIEPKGIHWINVTGTQHSERNSNIAEVDKAIELVVQLATRHPNASIGITTPFRHQADELKRRIPENIRTRVTADTVHRYQGDEKDIMIVSLVVTNNSTLGKVSWINRKVPYLINVAVTRARSTLYVVGNAAFLRQQSGDTPLGHLVRYVENVRANRN